MTDNFRKSTLREEAAKFDPYVHAVTMIDEPHRMAHDGFMFHASGKETGLIDTGVSDLVMVTGAKPVHLQRLNLAFGKGDVDVQSYEAPTINVIGAPQVAFNTNRLSSRTAGMILYPAATITAPGTLLHTLWVPPTPTGRGRSASGISNVSNGEEWILAPVTAYLIRITNNSGDTIDLTFETLFYEVDYDHSD